MKALIFGAAFVLSVVCTPLRSQDAIPLLAFCTGARPASGPAADFYDKECPGVLASALQSGQQAVDASSVKAGTDAATAKADLEKQQIDNLKALLPAGATVPAAPTGVSLDPLAHLSQLRQVALFQEIATNILGSDRRLKAIDKDYRVVIAQESEIQQLLRGTLPPEALIDELDRDRSLVVATATACKAPAPAAPKINGMRVPAMGGALLVADSLLGLALKVSQAFQTNLMATSAANLASGGGEVVAVTLASKLVDAHAKVMVGLPIVQSTNPVILQLNKLQDSSLALVQAMSKTDEKDPCVASGKALLEAVSTRLNALNSSPDATTPSPMLSSMRLAELRCPGVVTADACKNYVRSKSLVFSVDAVLGGGSFIATKSAFTSQKYVRLATAAVTYRVQDADGFVLGAGVEMMPSDTSTNAADIGRLDKNLDLSPPPKDSKN